jgi:hypothetical protein
MHDLALGIGLKLDGRDLAWGLGARGQQAGFLGGREALGPHLWDGGLLPAFGKLYLGHLVDFVGHIERINTMDVFAYTLSRFLAG